MRAKLRSSNPFLCLRIATLMVLLGLCLAACSLVPISKAESARQTEIRATELDIHVKQTLLSLQQLDRGAALTALAGTSQVLQQTAEASLAVPASAAPPAAVETPVSLPPAVEPTQPPPPPKPATPAPIDDAALKAWMKSAQILLYEDMTAKLNTVRFVKSALEEMGLPFKDDGSAYGWLLDDLETGPPSGEAWDLIIIAAEDKAGLQADFFSPALNAINQGTSTILEVYYLNNAHYNAANALMERCGIQYENDWTRIPPSRAALFVLAPDDPVLQQPNSGLSFTNTSSYWWDSEGKIDYDIGDLVKLGPGSQARLLLGIGPDSTTSHAVATVCMDGKLTLQTFSSHSLTFNTMLPVWENYIYNALRTRFSNLK